MWLDVARYAEDQAHIVGNDTSLTYPNAYLYRDWVIRRSTTTCPTTSSSNGNWRPT
jgi:hypothetical protein